jgi:hypothetical protein
MWQKALDFYNSETGRRIFKWVTTALGVLLSSGTIPLDTPLVLGLSLGQILTIFGLGTPSAPPTAVLNRLK